MNGYQMYVTYSLKQFDISSNRLTRTKKFCFTILTSLKIFHLQQNSILNLEDNSFYELLHLRLLDLSCNKITNLKNKLFNGLNNIKTINLTFNLIMFVDSDAFRDVSPRTVHSFDLKVCCMHGSWTRCKAKKKNTFLNCDDLLSNKFMKYLSFLVGSLTIFLNIISFFLNIKKKRMENRTQNIFNPYLAVTDWLFGVQLVIISIADMHYKGNYIGLEMSRRSSLACKLASFLAFVSMTISSIILCIIMLTRFCVIQWPMNSKFRDKSFVKRLMEVSFTFTICFCIVFISSIFSFIGNPGLIGICLPLYTFNAHSVLLLFSTVIIVIVQTFCLVTIITLSIVSLHILKKNGNCRKTHTKKTKYGKVSKQLFLIIIINACS